MQSLSAPTKHKPHAHPAKSQKRLKMYYPQDPPDPDPEDGGDGDEPDDPNDESPEDNEPGERFLQVMSDLATGICTLCQPYTKSRPKKVKVQEPDTFDSTDPCKL